MAANSRILLVSTDADLSLDLFYAKESISLIRPFTIKYQASDEELNKIFQNEFDYIYFRDPFNDQNISQQLARQNSDKIFERYRSVYKVDGIQGYEDMLFEDKWIQYKKFKQFMPKSSLLDSLDISWPKERFIKKRISARSKGVIFCRQDFPDHANPKDYIDQVRLGIETEYRVNMVGQEVIRPMAIKTSKSETEGVRLITEEFNIPNEILEISQFVYDKTHFDFVGLDIARIKNRFILLEVNRSPQFNGYARLTNINLAVKLYEHLLNIDKIN